MTKKTETATCAMRIFEFRASNLFRDSVRAGLALFGFRILFLVSLRRFDGSEEDGDRDRDVAYEQQPGENSSSNGELRGESLVI